MYIKGRLQADSKLPAKIVEEKKKSDTPVKAKE